jgi:hypothetical protein
MPDINNLKDQRLILAHSFSGVSLSLVERMWWSRALHIIVARKQRKGIQEESRAGCNPQRHAPSDLLPSSRLHFLPFTFSQ